MFTSEHITFLREQLTRAEETAAGWRALLTYAQANMTGASPLFSPTPGSNPYPSDTRVFPQIGQEDPRSAWTPEHERSFQGFEAAHKELAEETGSGS